MSSSDKHTVAKRTWLQRSIFFALFILCSITGIEQQNSNERHAIVFCGEYIPVDDNFVADKLMKVIKSQMNYVNMPSLRQSASLYFPYVTAYLKKYNLPEDFKYLPIVESGFRLLSSSVGARGFWQLMPETARDLGLRVDAVVDERDDIEKSTIAACKVLKDFHQYLLKRHNLPSWVLTAAAYNFGIGNMSKAIQKQGANYFNMNLNSETALYVYKIVAIKELFEFPELYMKNFGYNIFAKQAPAKASKAYANENLTDNVAVTSLEKYVNQNKPKLQTKAPVTKNFTAYIEGKYRNFKDGSLVKIKLAEDVEFPGFFRRKGNLFIGNGWIIDNRVYVELPYGHSLQLYDQGFEKGIPLGNLKKDEPVILRLTLMEEPE